MRKVSPELQAADEKTRREQRFFGILRIVLAAILFGLWLASYVRAGAQEVVEIEQKANHGALSNCGETQVEIRLDERRDNRPQTSCEGPLGEVNFAVVTCDETTLVAVRVTEKGDFQGTASLMVRAHCGEPYSGERTQLTCPSVGGFVEFDLPITDGRYEWVCNPAS